MRLRAGRKELLSPKTRHDTRIKINCPYHVQPEAGRDQSELASIARGVADSRRGIAMSANADLLVRRRARHDWRALYQVALGHRNLPAWLPLLQTGHAEDRYPSQATASSYSMLVFRRAA